MTQDELIRLARIGAEARLAMLQSEIEAIYLNFPDLRTGKSSVARQGRPAAAARVATTRRRGTMSAAARRAVSLAQKKRWAEWRKKHGKA
jgi:hypothetical protein